MGDYIIGPIKIIDDGDGIYEAPLEDGTPIDEIQNLQGDSVYVTETDAQEALRQLGITSLTGLRLSPASRYLHLFAQARGHAASGDLLHTQDELREARASARLAALPYSETRSEEILKLALRSKLDSVMSEAQQLSDQGDIAGLQDSLNAARDLLMRLGVNLKDAMSLGFPYSPNLAESLEQHAYSIAMLRAWDEARKSAKAGNVFKTSEQLRKLEQFSQVGLGGLTRDQEKEGEKILQQAYRQAVPLYLEQAEALAQLGNVEKTRSLLEEAREAAQLGGGTMKKKHKTRAKKIEKLALKYSPRFLLPLAREAAQTGNVDETRRWIQRAKDDRAELGLTLESKQIKEAAAIEKLALQTSIDVLLKQAELEVTSVKKTGDMAPLRQFIQSARENARLTGVDFDAAQEKRVEEILSRAAQGAVDWRFNQALHSSNLGKVDDTLVPLNAAREFANLYGVKFDEFRAKRLVIQSLENGIELSFTAAEHFAKRRDVENTYFQLDNARDYARRLKQSFDEKRAEKIIDLLP